MLKGLIIPWPTDWKQEGLMIKLFSTLTAFLDTHEVHYKKLFSALVPYFIIEVHSQELKISQIIQAFLLILPMGEM